MNYAGRLRGLQKKMAESDIDLVVYESCPNLQYLTGLPVDWRNPLGNSLISNAVFVPREGDPILMSAGDINIKQCWIKDVRTMAKGQTCGDLVKSILTGKGAKIRKIGFGVSPKGSSVIAAVKAVSTAEEIDASKSMDHLRMIKEPDEIELLKKAARLIDQVMETIISGIGAGTTQKDLMLNIESEALKRGASHMSFDPWAGFSRPKTEYPVDKPIEPGTAIAFDVGFVLNGYCSDWGRSFFWGTPPEHLAKGHKALWQAQLEMVSILHAGAMRACDVYTTMEKILDRSGFGDFLRARLASNKIMGHQIGVDLHEDPWLRPDFSEVLQENMVMCIEPKLQYTGEYYLRLEDMILITKNGAEFLTHYDRERFVL